MEILSPVGNYLPTSSALHAKKMILFPVIGFVLYPVGSFCSMLHGCQSLFIKCFYFGGLEKPLQKIHNIITKRETDGSSKDYLYINLQSKLQQYVLLPNSANTNTGLYESLF